MSESLFMPQSIGSIIGSILTTAFNLGVLARNISNAPAHIQRVCTEAELCKALVLTIKALLYQIETNGVNKDPQELIYISTLARVLVGCQEVLDSLEQEVEGLMKENMGIGTNNRVRWVWREQEIDRHLKSLEASKLALNIALNVLNIHQGWEIRKQNAYILNCITGNNTATSSLILPQEAMQAPTGLRRLNLTLSTVTEVDSAGDCKHASDAESSIIPAEVNDIYENSTVVSTSTPTETSESHYFETVLLASRVYQNKYSKSESPLLQCNVTWSELHRSGTSIFSYRSRSSLPVAVALVKTRAPIAILTKNRNRLNEALFEATRKQDITAISIFLNYGADINAVGNTFNGNKPLHPAATLGNIDIVRFLLTHGANVNAVNGKFEVPLHVAGQADVIKLLLQHGADIEAMDNLGETALLRRARFGQLEDMKALLEAGADIRKGNAVGRTVLHAAADRSGDVVRYLLQCGADIESADDKNETALFMAARARNLEVVETLLEAGADFKKKNALGQTALHVVMDTRQSRSRDIVRYLLRGGADIESADNKSETALFMAARAGNLEVVETLLEVGADFEKKNALGQSVLHVAAKAGWFESRDIVRFLLQNGADIESADNNNETALFMAMRAENWDVMETLLEAGANFKKKNTLGETVLHVAVQGCLYHAVRYLLRRGVDIESTDNNNETPLFMASRAGNFGTVETLLKAGADFKKKNALGRTVLHAATEEWVGNRDVVRYLLRRGADMESADNENETPLFMAVRARNLEVVKTLLEAGADFNKKNALGQTVLHVAAKAGRFESKNIVKCLLRHGADIESADDKNETPLFMAVRAGNLDEVETLLEAGADREKKNTSGQRAFDVVDSTKDEWSGGKYVTC